MDDTEKTDEFTLAANLIRPERKDKNENVLLQNIEFSAQIKMIKELSLVLQVNTNTHNENEEEWVTLYKSMLPLPDKTSIQAKLSNTKQKHARLTSDLLKELQTTPVDDVIYTNNFPSTSTLYVTPVTGLMEQPMVEYTDTSLDLHADKKQIPCASITKLGFSLDISGFQSGSYPFTVNDKEGVFTVAQGGMLFTSTPGEANAKVIKQATRQIGYDAWSNKISEIDSLGHVTDYAYNYRNQLSIKIDPEVDVVHLIGGDKYELKPERPVTIYGYNARSFKVGITDANQHTQGVILDSSGHTIVTVLADGTYMNTVQYDALNRITQRVDSRNNVWLNTYNRNNNLLSTHSPLGKINTYDYNELGYRNIESNPASETRHYNFDPQNNLIARYEPLGQCTTMQYERGQLIQTTNPDGGILTWKRDYFGLPQEHKDLNDTTYHYIYNLNKQTTHQYSTGGYHSNYYKLTKVTVNEWLVTPNGPPIPITIDYYNRDLIAVPNQDMFYEYALGQVIKITDNASDKLTFYIHDTENRITSIKVTNLKGDYVLRNVETKVDALSREIYTHDNDGTFITGYDAVSNRRFVHASIVPTEDNGVTQESVTFWDYDPADRCTIDNGILKDGKIQIAPGKGIAYIYEKGLRITETKIKGSEIIIATQNFDADGFLVGSDINTGEKTTRDYHLAGWQKQFKDTVKLAGGPFVHYDHQVLCDANGRITHDWQTKDDNPQVETLFKYKVKEEDPDVSQVPLSQITNYHDAARTTDILANTYIGREDKQLSSVSGTRYNKYGHSRVSKVQVDFGPNNEQNAIIGAQGEKEFDAEWQTSKDVFFDTTSDGLVISRLTLYGVGKSFFGTEDFFMEASKSKYFYNVNGGFLGTYDQIVDKDYNYKIHINTDLIKHFPLQAGEYELTLTPPYRDATPYGIGYLSKNKPGIIFGSGGHNNSIDKPQNFYLTPKTKPHYGNLQINDFLRPNTFFDPMLGKTDDWVGWHRLTTTAYGGENTVALSQSSTIAQFGDTYESIARRTKGDESLASLIAEANGDVPLQPGRPILIPQMSLSQNKAGYARPYAELMSLIQGNITPYLITPRPDDDNWWEIVISVVVIAIAMYVSGPLAAGIIASLEVSTEVAAIIIAVTTALADAVLQGIAVGIGLQSHFSWQQVVEAGLMAGIGAEFADEAVAAQGGSAAVEKTLGQQIVEKMITAGKVSVSMQLAEMAVGYRKQFDIASVAAAMIGAGMDVKLSKSGMLDPYGVVSLTSRSLLDAGLHGQSPNIEMLAAQMTGQVLVYGAIIRENPNRNETNPTSKKYGQSQQAANGDTTQPRNNRNGEERREFRIARSSTSRPAVSSRYKPSTTADMLDAQNVANMELPSIAIDSNNSSELANRYLNGGKISDQSTSASNKWTGFWSRATSEGAKIIEEQGPLGKSYYNTKTGETYVPDGKGNYRSFYDAPLQKLYPEKYLLPFVNGGRTISFALKLFGIFNDENPVNAQSTVIRERVLANIAQSHIGNNSSNFLIYAAKEDQFLSGYNPDTWSMVNLNKGDVVYGGLPGQSAYYTSERTLVGSGYNQENLFKSLQVKPSPEFGYRPLIGKYILTQDVRIPVGIVQENPSLGFGGGEQFFIYNFKNTLKLLEKINLEQTYEYKLPTNRSNF